MKPKKVKSLYVSGKISGEKRYTKKFEEAYYKLRDAGYWVHLPMDAVARPKNWQHAMRRCISYMLLNAEGVALLPDWVDSRGAKLEREIALALDMPVKPIEEWLGGIKGNLTFDDSIFAGYRKRR